MSTSSRSRWRQLRLWLSTLFRDYAIFRLWINPISQVAPGVYRSSHPLPYQIHRAARLGVRTVLNLRGMREDEPAYVLEKQACDQDGLKLVQFRMHSRDVPDRAQLLAFAELVKQLEYPILLHCKSGADRAGLASALILILRDGVAPEIAARQLSLKFGHIRQAKTGILDYFVERYAQEYRAHGTGLLDWVRGTYDADALRRGFKASRWATLITDRILRRE